MKKFTNTIITLIPLLSLFAIWEFASLSSQKTRFLFSSPWQIFITLFDNIINGNLVNHTLVTFYEALIGLILGLFVGSCIGFILLYLPKIFKSSKYYIVALSSIPIFAIAPMMIIWFGTGLNMKIAMAFFSTVFVALFQAYKGGSSVSKEHLDFFKMNKASNNQKFWKLILPYSIDWLIQSLKLNSGLAILGAFIGEFIAAEKGLGYAIVKASGVYDVSYVLAATVCIIVLTVVFNVFADFIEKNKLRIIRKLSS